VSPWHLMPERGRGRPDSHDHEQANRCQIAQQHAPARDVEGPGGETDGEAHDQRQAEVHAE